MKVTIEFDNEDEDIAAVLGALSSMLGGAAPPTSAKKPPRKPSEPVKGNPDEPAQTATGPGVATGVTAVVETVAAVTPVKLKADAPAEIVALQAKPADRDTVGKALLKACKPVEEGGLSRTVALGLTEKFRPAGNTEKLVKVGMIPNEQLAALAALVLAEYAK